MAKVSPNTPQLTFKYEKSPLFRVIHVDGAGGTLSPAGRYILMNVYSDIAPTPDLDTYEVMGDDPTVLERTTPPVQGRLAREMQAALIIDIPTAISIRDWLGARIDEYQKAHGDAQ